MLSAFSLRVSAKLFVSSLTSNRLALSPLIVLSMLLFFVAFCSVPFLEFIGDKGDSSKNGGIVNKTEVNAIQLIWYSHGLKLSLAFQLADESSNERSGSPNEISGNVISGRLNALNGISITT